MQIEPVVRFVLLQPDQDYLLNRVLEITGPCRFHTLQAPETF